MNIPSRCFSKCIEESALRTQLIYFFKYRGIGTVQNRVNLTEIPKAFLCKIYNIALSLAICVHILIILKVNRSKNLT